MRLLVANLLASDAGKDLFESKDTAPKKRQSPEPLICQFDKIIGIDWQNAVARLNIADGKRTSSFYFFMRRSDKWRIRCVRALALTGILESILKEYDENPSSRNEVPEHDIRNIRLVLSSDLELRQWFHKKRTEIEKIAAMVRKKPEESESKAEHKAKIKQARQDIDLQNAYVGRDDSMPPFCRRHGR
ncbi:MAG: hypothetical protein ACI97A_002201 [Planctomycetota bacterium]